MERESFENESIAALLNENFVCIKVDREERPDVDQIYMAYVLSSTGGGGWPMSVWLTPDRKPFFGGTYFPRRLADAWSKDRDRIVHASDNISAPLTPASRRSAAASMRSAAGLEARRNFRGRL